MNKLISAYMVIFVIFIFFNGIMEGGGGLNSTKLDGALSLAATTISVDSTQGFLTADQLIINDEEMTYTGITSTTFTGVIRAVNNTVAVAHQDNTQVYSPDAGVLNRVLGFNVASTGATAGTLAVVTMTWTFLTKALPNLILWDFAFLQGQLVYVRIIFMAIGSGLVVMLGLQFITTARGILVR